VHLKSLKEYPPVQDFDTLNMKKAADATMKKLGNPNGASK